MKPRIGQIYRIKEPLFEWEDYILITDTNSVGKVSAQLVASIDSGRFPVARKIFNLTPSDLHTLLTEYKLTPYTLDDLLGLSLVIPNFKLVNIYDTN